MASTTNKEASVHSRRPIRDPPTCARFNRSGPGLLRDQASAQVRRMRSRIRFEIKGRDAPTAVCKRRQPIRGTPCSFAMRRIIAGNCVLFRALSERIWQPLQLGHSFAAAHAHKHEAVRHRLFGRSRSEQIHGSNNREANGGRNEAILHGRRTCLVAPKTHRELAKQL